MNAEPGTGSLVNGLAIVVVGVWALAMRQTNVFWVVVLLGGLEAVNAVKGLEPEPAKIASNATLKETVKFFTWRASIGDIHDLPLSKARVEGKFVCSQSMTRSSLTHKTGCSPLSAFS